MGVRPASPPRRLEQRAVSVAVLHSDGWVKEGDGSASLVPEAPLSCKLHSCPAHARGSCGRHPLIDHCKALCFLHKATDTTQFSSAATQGDESPGTDSKPPRRSLLLPNQPARIPFRRVVSPGRATTYASVNYPPYPRRHQRQQGRQGLFCRSRLLLASTYKREHLRLSSTLLRPQTAVYIVASAIQSLLVRPCAPTPPHSTSWRRSDE